MLKKLKKIYDNIDIYDLNNIVIVICIILFLISLYITKNTYIFIIMYIIILFLGSHFNNKIIKLISNILPVILFGYFLMHFIHFSMFKYLTFNTFIIIIKLLMFIDYILIIINYIKNKKIYLIKIFRKRSKHYSFKELRNKNIDKVKEINREEIDKFLKENKIEKTSDYYKVIENNFENKSKIDLEEYVWINYLRFYKNKRFNKINIFDRFNFIFLIIHVIMLLLVLLVR